MISLDSFFSDKYVNKKAVGGNILLLAMYRCAYPFSFGLNRLNVSPNQITWSSIIFAIMAAYAIVFFESEFYYMVFWAISLLLDFCDGTVARMSNNISKTALRFDHFSDLFKIFIVLFSVVFHYNDIVVWSLGMTALFFFMYYVTLNHELSSAKKLIVREQVSDDKNHSVSGSKFKSVNKSIKSQLLKRVVLGIYFSVTTINGHTLLIFLLLPLGKVFAIGVFVYFGLVSIFNSYHRIIALTQIPRKRMNKNGQM